MRTSIVFMLASLMIAPAARAEETRFRPATEAQILRYLKGADDLTKARDGYSYRAGSTTGYKISRGQICVKSKRNAIDCVQIKTNGVKFQMIDRDGNREIF